jgi:hypothetical protein
MSLSTLQYGCLVEGVPPPVPAWVGTPGTCNVIWYGRVLILQEEGRPGEVPRGQVPRMSSGTVLQGDRVVPRSSAIQARPVVGSSFPSSRALLWSSAHTTSHMALEPNSARLAKCVWMYVRIPGGGATPCIGIRQSRPFVI